MRILRYFLPAMACALMCGGCRKAEFGVAGNVQQGADSTLVLEKLDAVAGWLALDSVKIASDGSFAFTSPSPEEPELYRLAMGGRYIYLPVDSLEQLQVSATARDFDGAFTLSGSKQAEQLTAFEREARRVSRLENADSTEAFRRRVYEQYLRDAKGNILSYYILTRPWGDEMFVDYRSPLYAAVATAFETYRPGDSHTARLAEQARRGQAERRKASGKGVKMQAQASGVVPISLPGLDGKQVSLESLLGKGKPVVVAFMAMNRDDAPAINRRLRELYTAGLADIYAVCLDADQFAWRQASKALPWTVVIDPDGEHSPAALRYNVGSVPAFFIYNASGDLVQSTGNVEQVRNLL